MENHKLKCTVRPADRGGEAFELLHVIISSLLCSYDLFIMCTDRKSIMSVEAEKREGSSYLW